jgi:hypothetical protein
LDSVRKRDASPRGTTKLRETETPGVVSSESLAIVMKKIQRKKIKNKNQSYGLEGEKKQKKKKKTEI